MQQTLADEGIRLTCVTRATTDEVKLIYNYQASRLAREPRDQLTDPRCVEGRCIVPGISHR